MALKFLNDGYFAGKVGIGIQSPAAKLHVNPTTTDEIAIAINGTQNYSAGEFQRIAAGDASSTGNDWGNAANTEKMVITSAGNVGIGTGSPDNLLHVQGSNNPRIDLGEDTNNKGWMRWNNADNYIDFTTRVGGTYYADTLVLRNGNVGIGTTGPTGKLTIADTAFTTAYNSIKGLFFDNSNISSGDENFGAGIEFGKLSNGGNLYKKAAIIPVQSGSDSDQMGISFFVSNTVSQASPVIEAMRVDYGGNVGIGTTSPSDYYSDNLVVKQATGAGGITIATDTSSEGALYFADGTSGNQRYEGGVGYNHSINKLFLVSGGQSRVFIDSTGNVGIGTISPGYKLDVTGDARFGDGNNFNPLIQYAGSGRVAASPGYSFVGDLDTGMFNPNLGNTLAFTTGGTERMRIDSNGSVSFGGSTTLSNTAASIQHFSTNGYLYIYGGTGGVVIGDDSTATRMQIQDNNDIWFETAGTERMRIANGGNVGIGTTSPDLKLDVTHATSGEYVATFQNTAANLELKLGVTSTNYLNIQGQEIGNSNAYNMSLQADGGNVGINTTIPTQKLHVSGNARVTGAYYDSNNSPGAANQVLVSTVSGTDWVDGSGSSIIGGPYLPLAGGTMTGTIIQNGGNIDFSDGRSANFGNGDDLQIYHDGSNSYINETGTGSLVVKTGALLVRNPSDASMLDAQSGGAINLYYNGSKKFETTNTGVAVTGDVVIDSALLSNQENTDVDTGTETVANVAIATYTAAFFDFVIKKTTNVRSGTVYACHDGTNVEFTETSTQDLGDTSDVTLSVDISGGNMRLLTTVISDDWSVKSLIRAI